MEPTTAVIIDSEPVEFRIDNNDLGTAAIPVVIGFNADGSFQTAWDLAEREKLNPADCDHAGATWSSNFDMRCPRCGAAMFLPPRLLAHLPAFAIWAMNLLWSAAGWPEWRNESWSIVPDKWKITWHPLFNFCGGIPVRHDHLEKYYDALIELVEDGYV